MAFAFLFPGQGSQSLRMMDGLASFPVVQQTFDEASAVLNEDLWEMLQADSSEIINATVNTQPIMLAAGVATWRVWLQLGGLPPTYVVGHSLGEYTALVAAGALNFTDAVYLVRQRAQAMQTAVPQEMGAMAAILGLDDEQVVAACRDAAQGAVVAAVNFNAPGQVVIAGERVAVVRAMQACKTQGAKRALLLPVSVPSHCALMRTAAEQFAKTVAQIEFHAPQITLLHNVDLKSHTDSIGIIDALVRQLYSPVHWTHTIQKIVANGVVRMAECGPGNVLTGLVKRIDSNVTCMALTDTVAFNTAMSKL